MSLDDRLAELEARLRRCGSPPVAFSRGVDSAFLLAAALRAVDAGLTKAGVRAAARAWGLPVWDKPAAACLASRLACGVPVSVARLARVERAESGLRRALVAAGYPVRDLRVRDLGPAGARVEVD